MTDEWIDLTNDPTDAEGFVLLAATIVEARGTTRERAAALAMGRARLGASRGRIAMDVADATGAALAAWLRVQQEVTT